MKLEERIRYILPIVFLSAVGVLYMFLRSRKLLQWKGKKHTEIHTVCNSQDWEKIHSHFQASYQQFRVIGFDCEWIYDENWRARPVALMQLATHQGICTLIRLCKFKQTIPSSLVQILQDRSILKVGVGIIQDAKRLERDYGLVVKGCLDLRYVVQRHSKFNVMKGRGLQALAKDIINVHLDKSVSIRCSNWEVDELTPRQVTYAANDALVAVHIAEQVILTADGNFWYNRLFGSISDSELMNRLLRFSNSTIDIDYLEISPTKKTGVTLVSNISTPKRIKKGYSFRKSELYHHCALKAPDGELLCMCDVKKAQWYLDKGLADMICEEPLTVRLKFEPASRPDDDGTYYTLEKDNICVVCGKTDSYIRKNVVPSEYRRYLPLCMKSHQSHDILLLCLDCHKKCSVHDFNLRRELGALCDAPFKEDVKIYSDPVLKKVRSSARALLLNINNLPDSRREELESILKEYYTVDHLNEILLQEASNLVTITNDDYLPHGFKVVHYMAQRGNLLNFEKRWRQHFLDNMQPKHLPRMWSVDHNHKRLEEKGIDVNLDFLQSYEKF